MKVERLCFEGFRNLQAGELAPDKGVNVIYGNNAQGKTNLLEAIWLFTGGRSFRGAKDRELIAFDAEFSRVALDYEAFGRRQQAKLLISAGKRQATLNGVEKPSASSLIGEFCAVVFSPAHLSLIKEGPSERRRFIDAAICQLKPAYAALLSRYNHTLSQRNALLKDISYHSELYDTLEIWEEKLARYGAAVSLERIRYAGRLKEEAAALYAGIAGNREEFSLCYRPAFQKGEAELDSLTRDLRACLRENRREDIINGVTGFGPHRDELQITLNGKSARSFGSQGQQRSCVLALKLSEASILKESIGELPVILLDDVMSELDAMRQDYILNHIEGFQVFITCCEKETVKKSLTGKTFCMDAGAMLMA